MYLKHVATISVFLAPIILAVVAPFNLDTRSGCNADNCLRALQRKGSAANSFCASYIAATTTGVTSTLCQSKKRKLTSNLLIGLPSYVPNFCGPSRVSSACSCIASQTSASQTSTSLTSTSLTSTSPTSTSLTSTSLSSTSLTSISLSSTSLTSSSQTSAPSACSTGQVVVNPVRLFRVYPPLSSFLARVLCSRDKYCSSTLGREWEPFLPCQTSFRATRHVIRALPCLSAQEEWKR